MRKYLYEPVKTVQNYVCRNAELARCLSVITDISFRPPTACRKALSFADELFDTDQDSQASPLKSILACSLVPS